MREATGGALILYLVIPIIIIFIFFISFVINYASAYRAANFLVTQMETGNSGSGNEDILRTKYNYTEGYECSCDSNLRGSVCSVSLKVRIDIPLIGAVDIFSVKNETKTLKEPKC